MAGCSQQKFLATSSQTEAEAQQTAPLRWPRLYLPGVLYEVYIVIPMSPMSKLRLRETNSPTQHHTNCPCLSVSRAQLCPHMHPAHSKPCSPKGCANVDSFPQCTFLRPAVPSPAQVSWEKR